MSKNINIVKELKGVGTDIAEGYLEIAPPIEEDDGFIDFEFHISIDMAGTNLTRTDLANLSKAKKFFDECVEVLSSPIKAEKETTSKKDKKRSKS
jgi:hypothetical protein